MQVLLLCQCVGIAASVWMAMRQDCYTAECKNTTGHVVVSILSVFVWLPSCLLSITANKCTCVCVWGGGYTMGYISHTRFIQDLMFTSANRVGHCSHCSHNFTESTSVYWRLTDCPLLSQCSMSTIHNLIQSTSTSAIGVFFLLVKVAQFSLLMFYKYGCTLHVCLLCHRSPSLLQQQSLLLPW